MVARPAVFSVCPCWLLLDGSSASAASVLASGHEVCILPVPIRTLFDKSCAYVLLVVNTPCGFLYALAVGVKRIAL